MNTLSEPTIQNNSKGIIRNSITTFFKIFNTFSLKKMSLRCET